MNFPEVRAMGGSIGGMGMGAAGLATHTPSPTPTPTDPSLPPTPSPMTAPPEPTTYLTFQSTPPLPSPPAASHPSIASMWGIGGFTTPPMPPPPPVGCPNTIASTLGIPQMPNVTYFNSRAPMGFNSSKPLAKQHISEERMTAHLNSLHLSDSYCNHRLGKGKVLRSKALSKSVVDEEEDEGLGGDGAMTLESDLQGATRLVIAEEMKKIVPGEAKLPQSILKKLTKPSMEVVLWQPPTSLLRTIITSNIDNKIKEAHNTTPNPPHTTSPSNHTTTNTSTSSLPSSTTSSTTSSTSSSSSSSPDSGISISSPPPALSFLGNNSVSRLAFLRRLHRHHDLHSRRHHRLHKHIHIGARTRPPLPPFDLVWLKGDKLPSSPSKTPGKPRTGPHAGSRG
ncbi:hypothetical protein GWK47_040535 [Chionoecetes opilio]|uniref:Uncharacterized protein n=1 Tax=Chionoecetes opilio TaxID=41210 RepID=A0A8J4YJQ8_CHIOP|nr:hypothetical protein GWK47_040535 [Chionoecetes opilio]